MSVSPCQSLHQRWNRILILSPLSFPDVFFLRNPSNISAGSGYYSLINTASHSRQSSYQNNDNVVEILHDAAAVASTAAGATSPSTTAPPTILLQQQHRRRRSIGGLSTTSDEGVGDRSSTTSFNSLRRNDEGGVGTGVGGGSLAASTLATSSSSQGSSSTTPIPAKRDRSRFKKLTPDPPSLTTTSGSGVELRGAHQKSGSHSLLGGGASAESTAAASSGNEAHHHHHPHSLYLGSLSGREMTSSSSSHTLSPLAPPLHGSQRLAETRVSSDAVIDDLFSDAVSGGI